MPITHEQQSLIEVASQLHSLGVRRFILSTGEVEFFFPPAATAAKAADHAESDPDEGVDAVDLMLRLRGEGV